MAGKPTSTSIQEATKNTIPYVPEDSIVYTSGDGRFQFAYVDPNSGGNKYAVILNYNANALAENSLTIPDNMEAFKKYKQTSSDGYFCLVTQNDEFMFYDVYEQATDDAGVLLYRVPAVKYGDYGHDVIPSGSQRENPSLLTGISYIMVPMKVHWFIVIKKKFKMKMGQNRMLRRIIR